MEEVDVKYGRENIQALILGINFNDRFFPCGNYLHNRPFMYINIFWTVMPIYVLLNL